MRREGGEGRRIGSARPALETSRRLLFLRLLLEPGPNQSLYYISARSYSSEENSSRLESELNPCWLPLMDPADSGCPERALPSSAIPKRRRKLTDRKSDKKAVPTRCEDRIQGEKGKETSWVFERNEGRAELIQALFGFSLSLLLPSSFLCLREALIQFTLSFHRSSLLQSKPTRDLQICLSRKQVNKLSISLFFEHSIFINGARR